MFLKVITGTTGLLTAPDSVQGGSRVVTFDVVSISRMESKVSMVSGFVRRPRRL
ncbi:hypothetical protein HanIR_Chr08g0377361 [Helianthus annuus]|nr:hypothetical protein HanIR_Chr08g0377361 [Helianthus annuus]